MQECTIISEDHLTALTSIVLIVNFKQWREWVSYAVAQRILDLEARELVCVLAEAVCWGKRGTRVNTISPGIAITR